jgi:hypothetical protein
MASAVMRWSSCWRFWLRFSSSSIQPRASSAFAERSSRMASSPWRMRPAEFRRGVTRKTISCPWGTVPGLILALSSSSSMPGRGLSCSSRSPSRTKAMFSSVSGTMSARVPSATSCRSRIGSDACAAPVASRTALPSFQARPAPQSPLLAYPQPSWWGSSSTSAWSGKDSPGRWWSVTMIPSPLARARAICGPAVTPVSTETTQVARGSAPSGRPSTPSPRRHLSRETSESPYPSPSRRGNVHPHCRPARRSDSQSRAVPVMPSTS